MTGSMLAIDVTGRDRDLAAGLGGGAETYLGLQIAGSRSDTVTGPGSPSVCATFPSRSNTVDGSRAASHLREGYRSIRSVETRRRMGPSRQRGGYATLLPEAGHSWYLGANVPGLGSSCVCRWDDPISLGLR